MEYKNFTEEDFLLDEKFVRWTNGDYSLEVYWNEVLEKNPDLLPVIEKAKKLQHGIDIKSQRITAASTQKIWQNVKQEMEVSEKSAGKQLQYRPVNNQSVWYKVAAILIPIAIVAGIWIFNGKIGNEEINASKVTWVEKINPKGQKLTLNLGDGTKILLNAESKVQLPEKFSKDKREVFLEGEAFFEVAHDANRPFVVYTNGVATKVLGTSFNINAYPENNKVQIALLSGKVRVQKLEGEDVLLDPLEKLEVDKDTKKSIKSTFDKADIIAWKNGILQFNDAQQNEIKDRLERWFGVNILIKKPIEGAFTGSFKDKSLEHILEIISETSDFKYSIEPKNVIIY